jgi:hypothetical protein
MLAALLLAGLAAAMVPFALDGVSDDDEDADLPAEGGGDAAGPAGDLIDGHDPAPPVDGPDGLSMPRLDQSDPLPDHRTVTLDTWARDVALTDAVGDKGAELTVTSESGEVVRIEFPGEAHVPVDAVLVRVADFDGNGPTEMPLAELLWTAEDLDDDPGADTGGEDILSPTDPDAPEDPPPGPIQPLSPLAPVDPDAPDAPPDDPFEGDALQPIDDDDTGQAWQTILSDPATGAPIPTRITDFTEDDVLFVTLAPNAASGPGAVDVIASSDGSASVVRIDGQPVAVVHGVPVDPSQVHVSSPIKPLR